MPHAASRTDQLPIYIRILVSLRDPAPPWNAWATLSESGNLPEFSTPANRPLEYLPNICHLSPLFPVPSPIAASGAIGGFVVSVL